MQHTVFKEFLIKAKEKDGSSHNYVYGARNLGEAEMYFYKQHPTDIILTIFNTAKITELKGRIKDWKEGIPKQIWL